MICFVAAEHNFYPQKKPQQCPHWDLAKTFDAKMLMRLWDGKIGVALNRMKVSMELKSKLLQNVMVTPCYKCDDSSLTKRPALDSTSGWLVFHVPAYEAKVNGHQIHPCVQVCTQIK